MTRWLWRRCPTRTHSELGRESLQRRWYFVLRHGRVGRCLVIQLHEPQQPARRRRGGKTSKEPATHHCAIAGFYIGLLARSFMRGIRLCARLIKPIERLVPVSFTHYCASTPGLSTWWSSTVLKRILVSRGASRLDAFSSYPFRT